MGVSTSPAAVAPRSDGTEGISVLGGGLAGLTASMTTKAPVYEAADHVGGVGASDGVDDFTFDRGIHVLNTKSPKVLSFFEEIGVDMVPVDRVAYIYSHGTFTPYPFQVNTAGLPLTLRARCLYDYLRRDSHQAPTNYQEWIYKSIGSGFAETFMIPYSEKFWGISPTQMTFEWTGNKIPQPSMAQVIRGAFWSRQTAVGSNATFHYPRNGGYGAVANALSNHTGELHLGHRATSFDADARSVTFENGHRLDYGLLINTIPLPDLVGIATSAPEEVRQASSRLRTNSIMVVNLGIDRPNITDGHWVHFPEKDICFFRLSFPFNFTPGLAPEGKSSISVEVSYDRENPPDRDALCDRVIADLIRVGLLRDAKEVVLRHTHDIPYGYCIYDTHRKSAVRTILQWLESVNVLSCGRYGLWTYFWSDEAINSGRNTGEKALRLIAGEAVPESEAEVA